MPLCPLLPWRIGCTGRDCVDEKEVPDLLYFPLYQWVRIFLMLFFLPVSSTGYFFGGLVENFLSIR